MGVRASKCVVPTEERAGVLAAVARDSDGMALELPQLRAREREALQADPEVVLTAVRSVSILERCSARSWQWPAVACRHQSTRQRGSPRAMAAGVPRAPRIAKATLERVF